MVFMKYTTLEDSMQKLHSYRNLTTGRATAIDLICGLYIILFSYAAVSKWLDFSKFELQLAKSPLLTKYSGVIPWGIPAIEIIISLLLVIPRFRLIGLYSAYSLMVIFTSYIVAITQFSEYIPCSCGGVLQNLTWNQHLLFNLFFLLLALLAIFLYRSETNQKQINKRFNS